MFDDARRYREQEALVGKGGVVVFFQGEVQGWVNQLRNPEHWQPGCIAVDEQGAIWNAVLTDKVSLSISGTQERHMFAHQIR
ncbi:MULTISPECIES: hypothetical protein [Paraburkholderia]|uniref:Uncharacterized protein n=1 Tax=Paraburkholderia unamae TaxID=219649 RepID=A0ACC6RQB4_9BURK